jgi:hypothetical protein
MYTVLGDAVEAEADLAAGEHCLGTSWPACELLPSYGGLLWGESEQCGVALMRRPGACLMIGTIRRKVNPSHPIGILGQP